MTTTSLWFGNYDVAVVVWVSLVLWVSALDNGLGRAPPMGWNSWNTFHCQVNQKLIIQTAQQIKAWKLDQLGYRYVNIDDCWMSMTRDNGKLVADPQRFPNGMKWMGDYLHEQGLLFGIYSSAGVRTCAGYPASLGHERVDAQTFADWGVDYLKYDNCFNLQQPSIVRYAAMRNALNATGRPILYSLCQWGTEQSWQWAASMGNTWRTTGDIEPHWSSIVGCFWQSQQQHADQSRPGAWLDPDMMEVGNGNLTWVENKSHFSLWILAKAPLLLGNDLSQLTPELFSIISNRELIDIHQDPDTPQATCYVGCDKTNWCAPNVDGEHIIHESDFYICNPTTTTTATTKDDEPCGHSHHNNNQNNNNDEDYSILATTRKGKHDNVIVALIINWHDTETLQLQTWNAVQILGVAPFPNQRVVIRDLWKHASVRKQSRGDDRMVIDNDDDNDDDDDDDKFTFDDLQHVPIPPLAPHDCLVYSFTTIPAVAAASNSIGGILDE